MLGDGHVAKTLRIRDSCATAHGAIHHRALILKGLAQAMSGVALGRHCRKIRA